MVKRLMPLMVLVLVLVGQTRPAPAPTAPARSGSVPAATRAAAAPASKPGSDGALPAATESVDLYALSPDEFFKRPETQARIKKDFADTALLEATIFQQSNRARAANKLAPFTHSWALELMARGHSQEMSDRQYFDHDSPVPENRLLFDRLKNVGLENVTAGENLAVLPAVEIGSGSFTIHTNPDGSETRTDDVTRKRLDYYTYAGLAEAVLTSWKNSPTHWDNLMDKEFKYLGVGVARGSYAHGQDSFYMTQNFSASVTDASEKAAVAKIQAPASEH